MNQMQQLPLAEVTEDHIERAKRMIGVGLDVEQVSQWLATHDADKAENKRLQAIVVTLPKCWRLVDGKRVQDVAVVPGMTVWLEDRGEIVCVSYWSDIPASECSDTREAAEAGGSDLDAKPPLR